jgi:gamma-glutamyltranspeptidase/glutathione hydrolase
VYYAFGSCFVAAETGILLHNRGHYFSLDPDSPNSLEPGKRPLHTLMASLALQRNRPWLVFGTMGADGQPQTTVQVLHHIMHGANPAEAVAAPRVLSGRFFLEDDHDRLLIESDFNTHTIDALVQAGHNVELAPEKDERLGHAHAIQLSPDGTAQAGSDPRSDGLAVTL